MAKIFVSWPGYSADDPQTGGRLTAAGHELELHPKLGARSAEELIARMAGCAGAIVSTDPFTATAIAANPALRVIARVGVGTDSVDLAAASARGIAVSITPGLNAETVADHTVALILALIRKLAEQNSSVKQGRWERVGPQTPSELASKTVGIIGAGTIGRAVVKRLANFGAHLIFFDAQVEAIEFATKVDSLDALLADSDVISLHAPLTAATRNLIDSRTLRLMKPSAFLINTARGGLIDEQVLFAALREGTIAGAALDVFVDEPPDPRSMADVPNLLVSPHIGGLSHESIRRMTISATDSVLQVLNGDLPPTVINAAALAKSRIEQGVPA